MAKKPHPLIGKTVGEYQVISRIGEGGMGEVFEGHHPVIGKRVAIKTLLPQLSRDADLVARFTAEARAVNAIRHRGIVDIFGFGQLDDETQYFVMEHLEGKPFDKVIAEQAPMAPADVLEWLDQIVDALGAAHAAGVVHRDIKPSNIYLVDTGHGEPYVKLLDFGIAKTDAVNGKATPQTRASMVIGTPDYMAPEQARGEPVGAATDFYALGCVTFEMLTGVSPFRQENPMATMFAHIEKPVRHPQELQPDLPDALDALVVWMLQKEPEQRPGSAAALLERLEQLWPVVKGVARPPRRQTGASVKRVSAPSVPAAKSPETRLAPPSQQVSAKTSMQRPPTGSKSLAPLMDDDALEPTKTDREQLPEPPPAPAPAHAASRWPLFLGIGVLTLLITVGALFALRPNEPPPARPPFIVAAPPPVQEPPPPPPAPKAEPVEPAPPPPSEPPPTVAQPAPVVAPKPAANGVTQAMLESRLRKLKTRLEQQEIAAGGEDRVLRKFLSEVQASVAQAKDEPSRKKAWAQLNELGAQLAP